MASSTSITVASGTRAAAAEVQVAEPEPTTVVFVNAKKAAPVVPVDEDVKASPPAKASATKDTTTIRSSSPVANGTTSHTATNGETNPSNKNNNDDDTANDNNALVIHSNSSTPAPAPTSAPPAVRPSINGASLNYENSNLEEIMLRQLEEDILAYNYDLDFCRAQIDEPTLTPQESRTLQLRILDLGHQIRHCQHRIETMRIQHRKPAYGGASYGSGGYQYQSINLLPSAPKHQRASTANPGASLKRAAPSQMQPMDLDGDDGQTPAAANKRAKTGTGANATPIGGGGHSISFDGAGAGEGDSTMDLTTSIDMDDGNGGSINMELQRLGYWKCRLCSAPKYLLAGTGRSPAAPCKWPLKDISKMITHFTEMHTEHTPSERCSELGAALSKNREFCPPLFFFFLCFSFWLVLVLTSDCYI